MANPLIGRRIATLLVAFTLALPALAGPRFGPVTGPIDRTNPPVQRPIDPAQPVFPTLPSDDLPMIETRLGFSITAPLLFFNNNGVLTYDAGTGQLSIDADPLLIRLDSSSAPIPIANPGNPARDITINIILDSSGNVVGGVPGNDLEIFGAVTIDGTTYSGLLVSGEVTDYMGQDSGGVTDFHSFRFSMTGGLLVDAGIYGMDVGIEITSESSTFTGSYSSDFVGEAKGNLGVVECKGTIGDFVWLDLDGNGIQDDGEPGIGNVGLTLRDSMGNALAVTVTNGNGFYQFSGLCAGDYLITVDMPPPGLDVTLINAPGSNDSNDSNDPAGTPVTLPDSSASNQTIDFGYVEPQLGSLGDFVWNDLDMDGIQDGNEPGISGVTVQLKDCNGNVLDTTTTNANGFYEFIDLAAGCYSVGFILPPGFEFSPQDANGNGSDTVDSDADPIMGMTGPIDLDPGENDPTNDAGMFEPPIGSLGDFVWNDLDRDGIQDGNEPGVDGVMVNLYSCDDLVTPIGMTTTDNTGFYQFTGLAAGCYQVEFILPPDFVFSPQDQTGDAIDSDPDTGTGFTGDINLGQGENNPDVDAGIFVPPSAELGDRFWEDLNGNGIQDPGEPGIDGVTVNLLDCENPANVLDSTVTAGGGLYLFDELPAGCYVIEFIPPQDCVLTEQDAGSDDEVDSDANGVGQTIQIDLADMESDRTWDAGCYFTAGLGDFVWNDLDQDGIQDAGEPGIEGLTVVLLDGDMTPTGMTTTTGPAGDYEFTGLAPGSYFVQFTSPPDFVFTLQDANSNNSDDVDSDANGNGKSDKIVLESGEFDPTIDAGVFVPNAPAITIEKSTNGDDADAPTGPLIPDGDPVLWEYVVTNTGNVTLTGVFVTDNQGVVVDCPTDTLAPNESMTCTGDGISDADPDQYMNVGDTCGLDPQGTEVCDDDPSHYFRADPAIDIEKATNTEDADTPTGPFVPVGGAITWTYVVINTGNVTLSDVLVTDNQGETVTCPLNTLTPGQMMTCMADGTAVSGQYANIGDVVGTPPPGAGDDVVDEDPSHYFGAAPGIDIEKATNGDDADTPTGPTINVGGAVEWTYVVTNTGNVDLTNIAVTDSDIGAITCPLTELAPSESMTCTANGTAVPGQYANIGDVIGTPPPGAGDPVDDEDPSHYFGANAAIDIEKATNGDDADLPTGPTIDVGGAVEWTYVVTNTGNVELTDIAVTDNIIGAISCPASSLLPGASFTCTANGTAAAGQYRNDSSVVGTPPTGAGDNVTDEDPSHYFGSDPSIDIEKATNGDDADLPTGPTIDVGGAVEWTYVVTNTGNVELTDIAVTDNIIGAISCPASSLLPGASFTCTANGTAAAGQYRNDSSVVGTPPTGAGDNVTDEDPSHYFGSDPSIDIEKATNGDDADLPTGPTIDVGGAVEWTYVVTNTGNVELTDIAVTDNIIGAISCPASSLLPGASFTCTANGTAAAGQYRNDSSVVGTPPTGAGDNVTDEDPSHYFGSDPSIDIEKATNGDDADLPTGPTIDVGGAVEWTYVVTNTGNVELTDIAVTDNIIGAISCPASSLLPGASFTCTANGTAAAGQYRNDSSVVGTPPTGAGDNVTDEDPSHYFGSDPSIDIEKATNGDDADLPTGPTIDVGGAVEWTYVVTNTGNVELTDIAVTDNIIGAISCPASSLLPGASFTCTANGTAAAGQYRNDSSVVGTPPTGAGDNVTDEDPSHYFGSDPSIDIEKATNGDDADLPTGPTIDVGGAVEWTYVVTNTGNVELTDIAVTDNIIGAISCPASSLLPGASFTCTANGTAAAGQYRNDSSVVGTPPTGAGDNVTDEDPSHYFGSDPSIDIEKATNGDDADLPTGPTIDVGGAVEWTYVVTNTGNVELTDIAVTDNIIGAISCPASSLLPGASFTCTANGTAAAGQYRNDSSVVGTPPTGAGDNVTDEDPSHYFGSDPSIDIEKATNGDDADLPTGPTIDVGGAVEWTYVVTNTGNVELTDIAVTDNIIGAISCPASSLLPGASFTCTANGTAAAGQYRNDSSVVGTPPTGAGDNVTDEDPSHYFGSDPSIDIEKATNGDDADTPTGPTIDVGGAVEWTYVVTNTGNVELTDIAVTDNIIGAISCPANSLLPGASFTCTANGTAAAGQYRNDSSVVGTPPTGAGDNVTDEDPSHYFGSDPSIDIEKATNGDDADLPTGPTIDVGGAVEWTYVVTNTGNVELTDIAVTDNIIGAISCPANSLLPGASFTCTANGTAAAGQYRNDSSVVGTPPTGAGDNVTDEDPSHYFGSNPAIDIEKATNGADADTETGPLITIGEDVNWTYVVTNTGNVALTDVTVTDSQGVTVNCPRDTLAINASFVCTAMGIAVEGQYMNNSTVVGTPPTGVDDNVTDQDPSHYFGIRPAIDIEKATNGQDADLPTGPIVVPGSTVNWTYLVTNTGNVALTEVMVTDNQGVVVTCPQNTLAVGESFTCTASGIAIEGQYDNVGTVVGTPPVGPPVNDADPSHYFGAMPAIDLEKLTNGENADNPTGPIVAVGSTVTWTYIITNMGNVVLDNIVLNDSVLGAITCNEGPIPPLSANGGSFICTVMGIATAGQYMNLGTVCGDDPMDTEVCDEDPSHYLGADPSIDIEKATNGDDADNPTGPLIEAGGLVTWTYVVTNDGNVPLTNVTVTDDQGVSVICPQDTLAVNESIECSATGTAVPGQYANIGDVVGTPPPGAGGPVRDEDPSHYFGVTPGIDIEKFTNGVNADDPNAGDAPQILPGDTVTWTYVVTNTGNVPLSNVSVSDDRGVIVVCPSDTLAVGASFECSATGTAEELSFGGEVVPGLCGTRPNAPLYENTGTASGTSPLGTLVQDNDASHYCNPEVCALTVSKTCLIPMPPASNFTCDKPIDSLTMIYNSSQPIRIKAWKGPVGSTLLADIDDIQPGEEITVMGYAGSPNDVFWEVFAAGTDTKLGESKFHLSCSDDNMDGPEDCGLPQGNGKDDDANALDIWLLEGMVDASGTLDCTAPATTGNSECAFQAFPASCETGNADFLTFLYTGDGCGASDNSQGDHECTGATDGGSAATFTDDSGNSTTLQPGDTITIPRNEAKNMTLSNAGGTETNVLHASCSQPIVAGDVYGSLTLVQIDGMGVGTDVVYTYEITNSSDVDIVSLDAIDNILGPIPGAPSSLAAGASVTLNASAFITDTVTNIAIIDGVTADGQMCNGMDDATVTILPPPPCDIDGEGVLDISSDRIKWNLTNNGASTATIESIDISWPNANGDLLEIKLDGDKIFDLDTPPNSIVIGSGDFINDLNKRQIPPGDTDTLEIKFGNDVVGPADAYQITVNFEEGCSVTFENIGLPFSCSKPIDELTMIWDGAADPIRVKAWKGDPGSSELLLDQSGVVVGQEVVVSGYAGSSNDVFWEIFSGGSKLGESNFHMSCSDNNMNGAEDCGKRQGNGKSDDNGLINDWLLEGMIDQDGPLDCTP